LKPSEALKVLKLLKVLKVLKPLSRSRERGWGEGSSSAARSDAVLLALSVMLLPSMALHYRLLPKEEVTKPLFCRRRGWGEGQGPTNTKRPLESRHSTAKEDP